MLVKPSPEFLQLQQALAGRFSLERELGRGGMGVVFLARDVALDRPVAIKLLPQSLAAQPPLRARFLREARTAAKLSHPNIVPIHLVEERDDLVYFVMTFVDGETLGQRVRRAGPLTASQATRMVQEVAWALAYAHGRGIVHRDVKPDNILLDKDSSRAMVTDFGIARVAETGTMSNAGEIVGTAHYMSPEQASGESVDGRSDLFSLGVTAFYALTGKLPFEAPNLPALVSRIVSAEAPRVAVLRADLPVALAEAVDRCLSKKPEARFASGEELAEALGVAGVTTEAAPQIRFLVRTVGELGSALVLLPIALWVGPSVWAALWPSDRQTALWLLFLVVGPIAMWLAHLVHAARQVIRGGFGPADVRRALEREARSFREEREIAFPDLDEPVERRLSRRRVWMRLGHYGVLTGLASAVLEGVTSASTDRPSALYLIGLLSLTLGMFCYLAAFVLKPLAWLRADGKPVSSRLRGEGFLLRGQGFLLRGQRFLGTRMWNFLFRMAGIGLDVQAQNAPPASERTEVRLALAAGDLFDRLPPALKGRFADVPRVVHRLEADADRLRKRESELSRVGTFEEVEAARAAVRARLASAVAALENIRLDLLRLDAGVGSADDLTADLEKARAIGAAVDAEVHGRKEVARILAEPT